MDMKRIIVVCSLFLASCSSDTHEVFSWDGLLQSDNEAFNLVMADLAKYQVQINYTQIDRDEYGKAKLSSQELLIDTQRYFYPASTVKMPAAFMALHKMNKLIDEEYALDRDSIMLHDSIRPPQSYVRIDTTHASGLPSLAHYINKVFVVSDNDAYNRLYEFCGQAYLNKSLQDLGVFDNSRIRTRVGISGFSTEDNRYTNPVKFVDQKGHILVRQEEEYNSADDLIFPYLTNTSKGKGYYDDDLDSIIMKPFDMSEKNFINVKDLEASLQRVILPENFSEEQRFKLRDEDYQFLYQAMSKYPIDYDFLKDNPDFYDGYVKFFMYGDTKEDIPDHIHIFNKVGFAYGTLTDCAYIFDTDTGVEFFLTATIYVNDNQIFNDGKYEYDEIGIPFLAELGRLVYQYEVKRKREYRMDFSKYLK